MATDGAPPGCYRDPWHARTACGAGAERPASQDLAANRPGQSARERAIAARRAAPLRSFLGRLLGTRTEEWAWRVGAEGEEGVARRLARLGEGWHVLHAVTVSEAGTDIDHVVIGPPGVFTLNTKNHSRARVWVAERGVLVNGQRTEYLRKSRHEAELARKRLGAACGFEVSVEAVIIVLASTLTIKAQPIDVHVVARRDVVHWLRSLAPVLRVPDVERIYAHARRDVTWRPTRHSTGGVR